MFGVLTSAQALIVTLFGGVGVFWGPVIGAAILVPLAEMLHAELGEFLPGIQGVVYGVAIIVIILVAPDGIYWKIRDRVMARRAACAPPAARLMRSRASPTTCRSRRRRPRPAFGAPILQLDGVSRAFGGLKAVDEVTLVGARGHDPRHHRAERRRQDHAVQRDQRLPRRRQAARCALRARRSAG